MSKAVFSAYLRALDLLQQALFACYSESGEDSLQMISARSALYRAVHSLRKRQSPETLQKIERLYESVFLLGLFRFRVTDRALFEVCRAELSELSLTCSAVLKDAGSHAMTESLAEFDRVRENFQHLYDGVLCVTARDPQVFQFFFAHLDAFRENISGLFEGGSGVAAD